MIMENGEVGTELGGFITGKASKSYPCTLESCVLTLEKGDEYYGLVIYHSRAHVYTLRFHPECFMPYAVSVSDGHA